MECTHKIVTTPVSAKELAASLPAEAWKKMGWRQGGKQKLHSRFVCQCH
jgi:hypothetical protein